MRIRSLVAALILGACSLSVSPAIADDVCAPIAPETPICVEFRARAVSAADVERLAVRLRSEHFEARRRGNAVIAQMPASEAASFLRAQIFECSDDGATRVEIRGGNIPGRLRHDITSFRVVDCN